MSFLKYKISLGLWVLFIVAFMGLYFGFDIVPKTRPNTAASFTDSIVPEKSVRELQIFIDTLKKSTLTLAQKRYTDSLEKGLQNHHTRKNYQLLLTFWKANTAKMSAIPYHYYLGEKAIFEKSETGTIFAGNFFLENTHTIADEAFKRLLSGVSVYFFQKAILINANSDSAHIGLARNEIEVGINPMQGISRLQEIVRKDSTNEYAVKTFARAQFQIGNYEKTLLLLNKLLKKEPQNIEILLYVAESYEKLGNAVKAIEYYEIAEKQVRNAEFIHRLREKIKSLQV